MFRIRITTDPDLTEDIEALIAPRYTTQEEAQDNAIRMMAAPPFLAVPDFCTDWDSPVLEGDYGWLCWLPFKHAGKDVPRICMVFVEEEEEPNE